MIWLAAFVIILVGACCFGLMIPLIVHPLLENGKEWVVIMIILALAAILAYLVIQ